MKRNPIYVFDNLNSIGISAVPIKAMIQINDSDGMGNPITVQLTDTTNLTPTSTVRDLLDLPNAYNVSGSSLFIESSVIGQPNGVASLDASGKIPGGMLPPLTSSRVFVVDTQNAMITLNAISGDIAVRTDINQNYIHNGGTAGDINDWTIYAAPESVTSVNGQGGNIVLTTSDIAEGTNLYYSDARFDARLLVNINDQLGSGATTTIWSANKITSELALKSDITYVDAVTNTKENSLGSPSTSGFILSSLIDGTRTWIAPNVGDMLASVYDTNGNGIVDNAELVNGLTVETAVPVGALFTDTIYNDTTIQAEVALNTSNILLKEDSLGNPAIDGQVLTSLIDGTRSWTTTGAGDMLASVYDTNGNGIVDNAELVNGLSVGTAVPVGAVFTDTVYTPGAGTTLARPAGPALGEYYFDTDLGLPIWFNGTIWIDAVGTAV